MDSQKSIRLNLGCGLTKINDFINVDIDHEVNPDRIWDLTQVPWPWAANSAEVILLSHTLEHLEKSLHNMVFVEALRVLKRNGSLVLLYPEFKVCVNNYFRNEKGMKEFWESCIYGRGTSKWDHHRSVTDSAEIKRALVDLGFQVNISKVQDSVPYYSVTTAIKVHDLTTYEDVLNQEIFKTEAVNLKDS